MLWCFWCNHACNLSDATMRDLLDTSMDTASGSNTGFLVYRLVNHRSVNHAGLLQQLLQHDCYSDQNGPPCA